MPFSSWQPKKRTDGILKVNGFPRSERVEIEPPKHRHFLESHFPAVLSLKFLRFLHPKSANATGVQNRSLTSRKTIHLRLLALTNSERLSHGNPLARHSPHDSDSMLQKTTFMITTTTNTMPLTLRLNNRHPPLIYTQERVRIAPRKTMRVEAPCSSSPSKKRNASSGTAHTPRSQRPHSSCRSWHAC